jgi:predicted porin
MKKTLVALAVLAAAGSVNAAEVYSNDGVTTSLSGVAEVQLIDNENFEKKDLAVRLDDFDITAATSVALSDDVAAVGAVSVGRSSNSENAPDNTATVDRTYVGFSSTEMGTVTFGQQTTIYDDLGNDFSYEFDKEKFAYGAIDSGTDVVKYVYDNGQFFGAIAHDLKESTSDETVTDGRLGVRVDSLELAVYASNYKESTTAKESSFNLQADYSLDALAFSASYGVIDNKIADEKITYIQANVKYTVDTTSYALGFATNDSDVDGVDTKNGVYANVTTKLAPSVKVYAEAGYADDSSRAEEFGYVTGMEVSF